MNLTTQHSRGIEYLLAIRLEIADTMSVQPIDGWQFFVTCGKRDCVVDLEHVNCDCGVYGIEKIPCSHAIAAGSFGYFEYRHTCVPAILEGVFVCIVLREYIYPSVGVVEPCKCLPPKEKRGSGRQKKSRWQSWFGVIQDESTQTAEATYGL